MFKIDSKKSNLLAQFYYFAFGLHIKIGFKIKIWHYDSRYMKINPVLDWAHRSDGD